jgi:transposase, IS5 family
VIRKGKAGKSNELDKMVTGNQIIIDYEVGARRPSNPDLLVPATDTQRPYR